MFPPPEILGYSINWFELITVLAGLMTLVFGRFYFRKFKSPNFAFRKLVAPIIALLVLGYIGTYLMAYLEGLAYAFVKSDQSYAYPFGQHKRFLGFIFLIFLMALVERFLPRQYLLSDFGDYFAVVMCFFIGLEANACLFDGHGCYGRFTNLPWGMMFLHGSAPTLLPVHPTPLYITIAHLVLFIFLIFMQKCHSVPNRLLLVLLLGTSVINFCVEFFKDIDALWLGLNFSQCIYGLIGITSALLLIFSKKSSTRESMH